MILLNNFIEAFLLCFVLGHCKSLAPVFKELGDKLASGGHKDIAVGFVDCTVHRDICTKAEVSLFLLL